MMIYNYVQKLRKIASELEKKAQKEELLKKLKAEYDIKVPTEAEYAHISKLYDSLKKIKSQIVKDSEIKLFGFADLGPSRKYYPNHGKYKDGALIINTQVIDDKSDYKDETTGKTLNKFDQTVYHEIGHGWDEVYGEKGVQLSLLPEWMNLSGWSEKPKTGMKRIRIHEKGCPEVIGEYYYSPDAKFTRFYGKRNPWDDWADSFSFYIADLKSIVPENKCKYFDKKLKKYYQ